MLFTVGSIIFSALALIFLYEKVFKMYYHYWHYTRQGVPCVGFPLPIIGTGHLASKFISNIKKIKMTPIEDFHMSRFGDGVYPPYFMEFRLNTCILFI